MCRGNISRDNIAKKYSADSVRLANNKKQGDTFLVKHRKFLREKNEIEKTKNNEKYKLMPFVAFLFKMIILTS